MHHRLSLLETQQTEQPWRVDGYHANLAGPISYNGFFKGVLGGKTIERLAIDRKSMGRSTHTLDVFGSAIFSPSPHLFNSMTGIRLLPIDKSEIPTDYKNLRAWKELSGDLLLNQTWIDLDKNMLEREINSFDFIIIRPQGPLHLAIAEMEDSPENFRTYLGIFYKMLNQAWTRLNPDDGRLFVEYPRAFARRHAQSAQWLERLNNSGIRSVWVDDGLQFLSKRIHPKIYRASLTNGLSLLLKALSPSTPHFLSPLNATLKL